MKKNFNKKNIVKIIKSFLGKINDFYLELLEVEESKVMSRSNKKFKGDFDFDNIVIY